MARVLVIDDDLGTRETLEWVLRLGGHDVRTAQSGVSGLRLAEGGEADVLLVDLRLPDIDGIELIRVVIGRTGPRPAILVMTGFGTMEAVIDAMKLGVIDFLVKPFSEDDILQAVERAVALTTQQWPTPFHADGVTRWARAVAEITKSLRDPKNCNAWAQLLNVAPDTLRTWCRTAGVSPKRSLDLGRVLRAAALSRSRSCSPARLLNVADPRTLLRLSVEAGIGLEVPPPALTEILALQTFVTDPLAIGELGRALRESNLNVTC